MHLILIVLILVLLSPLFASAQGLSSGSQPLSETVEVSVVNVEVIVTDKDGQRVRGLQPADFEIREDGELRSITNFSEFGSSDLSMLADESGTSVSTETGTATEKPVGRRIVFFFDDFALKPEKSEIFFRSLKELLRRSLRAEDRAMILTYKTRLRKQIDFTNDVSRLESELDKVARETPPPITLDRETREFEETSEFFVQAEQFAGGGGGAAGGSAADHIATSARQLAKQAFDATRRRIESLSAFITTLEGGEGRKVLIVASDRLSEYAGLQFFLPRTEQVVGPPPPDASGFNTKRLLDKLISKANESNVTLYTLHPSGLAERATAEDLASVNPARDYALLQNESAALTDLSAGTGGLTALGADSVRELLPAISEDLESYYFLGYRAEPGQKKTARKIAIKLHNSTYKARFRHSFVNRSFDDEINDRTVANLFDPIAASKIMIRVTARRDPKKKSGKFEIPISVQIPIDGLSPLPDGKHLKGSFTVYLATLDLRGGFSSPSRQTQKFSIPQGQIEAARKSHFTFDTKLRVGDVPEYISVVVVDDVSREAGYVRIPFLNAPR